MVTIKKIRQKNGFTLIELSIVIAILGLVVGGVFIGKDLLYAAKMRAQMTQLQEIFMNTKIFRTKYKYWPGDVPSDLASKYGFIPRSPYMYATGNGQIDGYWGTGATTGFSQSGEPMLFWADLGSADLMTPLPMVTAERVGNTYLTVDTGTNSYTLADILPKAASGGNGFIYVWSGGYSLRWNNLEHNGKSYLGIAGITSIGGGTDTPVTNMSMTPFTAYSIDSKMDDGLPQAGKVTTIYVDGSIHGGEPMIAWAHANRVDGGSTCMQWWCFGNLSNSPNQSAVPADEFSCYDNNNVAGETHYSTATNSSNLNCALSIELQE